LGLQGFGCNNMEPTDVFSLVCFGGAAFWHDFNPPRSRSD
jgi:hypothetical protein